MADAHNHTTDADPKPGTGNRGPLARRVLAYTDTMERLVPNVEKLSDWAPLVEFVTVDEFTRVGTFREIQNWHQYLEMLTKWASANQSFETTVRRITESGGLVYYEIEERHFRSGGGVEVVNSLTAFEFNHESKISRLDVYLQQSR